VNGAFRNSIAKLMHPSNIRTYNFVSLLLAITHLVCCEQSHSKLLENINTRSRGECVQLLESEFVGLPNIRLAAVISGGGRVSGARGQMSYLSPPLAGTAESPFLAPPPSGARGQLPPDSPRAATAGSNRQCVHNFFYFLKTKR
jgi:hypothetical protein